MAKKLTRPRGDHRSASTPPLDRSQEAFDLRRSIWAGFFKSRFWKIAQWVKPVPVGTIAVGTIIFLASLLFVGSVFFRNGRLPSPRISEAFSATIGLLSFCYVVHQNRELLTRVWENRWGKLFYGLLASVTVTGCKVLADQQIRMLTQSNPSLFSSAQQTITVFFIIVMIFAEIGIFMSMMLTIQLSKATFLSWGLWLFLPLNIGFRVREMLGLSNPSWRSLISSMTSFFALLWGTAFILEISTFLIGGFAGVVSNPADPTEALLLWSSFIPNDLGLADSEHVCKNLPSQTLVSPFSTKDAMPNQVIMAQPISTGPDRLGHSYTYHVVECSKPTSRLLD